VPSAIWLAPSHAGEYAKRLGNMRKHDDCQAGRAEKHEKPYAARFLYGPRLPGFGSLGVIVKRHLGLIGVTRPSA
jgi:hypothetical protein